MVVDVVGYFDDDRSTEAGRFYAVTPTWIASTPCRGSSSPATR